MATTTNYGWTTPDDTDLVKDGAAAIRTLGSSVDTTTKALNPSTTTGDIEYRSATANTNARLALGTAGQVLTVNSGATAPEWAPPASGGMTLINTGGTALSGSTTTISTIPGTFKELRIYVMDFFSSATNSPAMYFNSDTTAANYAYSGTRLFGANQAAVIGENNATTICLIGVPNTDQNNNLVITIPNYAETTAKKIYSVHSGVKDGANSAVTNTAHSWNDTTAITSLNFTTAGTWSGGTVYVYGVK
jgi:hypothetical protein